MDIYYNFYRMRLYLPLVILLIIWFFVPAVKRAVYGISGKIDKCGTSKVAFFMGAISFVFSIMAIYPGKSWGGDFSQYFAQARALATGTVAEWYERNQFIINTSCDGIGADVYPWFWAICLAPFYKFFGYFPYTPLKILEALAVAGTTITLVYIYKRRMKLLYAMFLAAFTAWNVNYIFYVNTIEADIICLFMVIETINIVDLYNRRSSKKLYYIYAVLSGIFIYFSVQTKTMAEGLLLALVCYDALILLQALCKRTGVRNPFTIDSFEGQLSFARLIPYIVYFVLTKITEWILPTAGGTYNGYFTVSLYRISYGLQEYFKEFMTFWGGGTDRAIITALQMALTILLLALTVIGSFVAFKKDSYMIIYLYGMAVMLLIYDYYRVGFIYTLFPIMLLLGFEGLKWLLRSMKITFFKYQIGGIAFIVLFMTFLASIYLCVNVRLCGYGNNEIETVPTQDVFEYIRTNLTKDDVVYFFKPRVLYFYTDVSSYTWNDEPDKLVYADYVLIDKWSNWNNVKEVLQDENQYELSYSNDTYYLYKTIR